MLAVDNQATGLLFIHDNIRGRIDAHRAFRALFREAREPDQHHRSTWLLASPHCPDIQTRQNLGVWGAWPHHSCSDRNRKATPALPSPATPNLAQPGPTALGLSRK